MPSPSFSIQLLGPQDIARVQAMLVVFSDAFYDAPTYSEHQPRTDYLQRLLARDSLIAVAALAGDTVVGGIVAYVLPKLEQERSEVYLYDMAVDPAHRRQGIATALVRALQREAAARGAYVIFVQADRGDDAAIALYSKMGGREDVLHFDIPISA